jgi:dihydrofolate reductase
MSKVKIGAFSVSLDGFGAGPRQDRENPLGVRGFELHAWFQKTAIFRKMHNLADGSQGVDNDFAAQSFENVGAWILGRNMFGPIRGPGKTIPGKAGGERSRRITCPSLSLRIMRARR